MINRILGWIFTLAVLAVVVFAAMNWGGYTSMCFNTREEGVEKEIEESASEPLNAVESASLPSEAESTL
jgi:hypothetical protein